MAANPLDSAPPTLDLASEAGAIARQDHGATGRLTRMLVSLPGLRVALVSMRRGAIWAEHATPGRITVQPLTGSIRFRALGHEFAVGAGQLVALPSNVPHDVHAEEDVVFLLTVARPMAD